MQLLVRIPPVAASVQRKAALRPGDTEAWGRLQELQASTMVRMVQRFPGTDNDIQTAATHDYASDGRRSARD
jgi:hypothetical protein